MKHIVCFSGGHSSALAAIETVRKYGKKNVILLNHDISPHVEHEDIKRFKQEVATDKTNSARFWADVRKAIPEEEAELPCDCAF